MYSKKETGIGLLTAIILIIVVTVVLASAIVYIAHSNSPTIYNTEPNLNLTVSLSQSTLNKGEGLNVSVELFNNESYFFTASVSNNWPYFLGVQTRMTMNPCSLDLPFGIVVLYEYYNLTNYSQGHPLIIYEPGTYACPIIFPVSSYEFLPLSDHALLISSENSPINYTMQSITYVNGSWVYVGNQLEFRNFSSGIYTVVTADEWGEIQIAHFTVH